MAEFNPNLWAPWRMEYIRSLGEESTHNGGCFLCQYLATSQEDADHHVVWRSTHSYVAMNRFPYTNGHLLIAVNRHVGDPGDLAPDELLDLTRTSFAALGVLRTVVHAEGFNLGANLGRCAGAGLPDHLHMHIVPRWNGDTNYMAVLGGVRVIPDALDSLYALLVEEAGARGLRE